MYESQGCVKWELWSGYGKKKYSSTFTNSWWAFFVKSYSKLSYILLNRWFSWFISVLIRITYGIKLFWTHYIILLSFIYLFYAKVNSLKASQVIGISFIQNNNVKRIQLDTT